MFGSRKFQPWFPICRSGRRRLQPAFLKGPGSQVCRSRMLLMMFGSRRLQPAFFERSLLHIREKKHRLSKDCYRGNTSVSFTFCLRDRIPAFTEPGIVKVFTDILADTAERSHCIIPVYCFMPDHQHAIFSGAGPDADLWKTAVSYKQRTGYWLSKNLPSVSWQKDFFDHIIRREDSLAAQVRYVLDNPVRKSLVRSWEEHPYKGSLGCRLEDVLSGIL